MRIFKIFVVLVLYLMLVQCSEKAGKENHSSTIRVKQIVFDPAEAPSVYIEDLMDTAYYVPLSSEKEFLIKSINAIQFDDSLIIIEDRAQRAIFMALARSEIIYSILKKQVS